MRRRRVCSSVAWLGIVSFREGVQVLSKEDWDGLSVLVSKRPLVGSLHVFDPRGYSQEKRCCPSTADTAFENEGFPRRPFAAG